LSPKQGNGVIAFGSLGRMLALCQREDKRLVDIVEDGFSKVGGVEFERSLVSGEGELICCFQKQPPMLVGKFYHVAECEETRRWKPKF
jgi:hypothetical protein